MYEEKKEFNVLQGRIPDFTVLNVEYVIGETSSTIKPENDGRYKQVAIDCSGVTNYNWDNEKWEVSYIKSDITEKEISCTVTFEALQISEDVMEVGDYVYYRPSNTSFTIWVSMTGYSQQQIINPSELTSWRVIRKNDNGTIDLVSTSTSSKIIYFSGENGIKNYVGSLQTIAQQYGTSGITSGARYMGYNGQTLTLTTLSTSSNPPESQGGNSSLHGTDIALVNGINALAIGKNYWIAGRSYYYQSGSHVSYYGVQIDASGNQTGNRMYSVDINGSGYKYDYNVSAYLRPIVTLKSGIVINQGDGTSGNPWKVN